MNEKRYQLKFDEACLAIASRDVTSAERLFCEAYDLLGEVDWKGDKEPQPIGRGFSIS